MLLYVPSSSFTPNPSKYFQTLLGLPWLLDSHFVSQEGQLCSPYPCPCLCLFLPTAVKWAKGVILKWHPQNFRNIRPPSCLCHCQTHATYQYCCHVLGNAPLPLSADALRVFFQYCPAEMRRPIQSRQLIRPGKASISMQYEQILSLDPGEKSKNQLGYYKNFAMLWARANPRPLLPYKLGAFV